MWLNTHVIMDSPWLEPVLAESVNTMESGQDLLQFVNVSSLDIPFITIHATQSIGHKLVLLL